MKCKSDYPCFYPLIVDLAEVALSAPIYKCMARKGSKHSLKRIKTRLKVEEWHAEYISVSQTVDLLDSFLFELE